MAGERPDWRLVGFESNLAAKAPAVEWSLHWVYCYSGSVVTGGNGNCAA